MYDAADHYAVLGLSPSADDVVVHAAWRALLRKHHPDTNPGDRAGIKAREINEAFAILGKPGARAAYDRTLHGRTGTAPRRDVPYVTPYFRPIPPPGFSVARFFGGMLLTLSTIPIISVVLLAYPATAPATHDALERLSADNPFAASLVARLDALMPSVAPDPAPRPASSVGSDQPEVATTR